MAEIIKPHNLFESYMEQKVGGMNIISFNSPTIGDDSHKVAIVEGAIPGKTIGIGAGVHGGEYPAERAVEAVYSVIIGGNIEIVKGRVVFIFNMTPDAVRRGTRLNGDGINPNAIPPDINNRKEELPVTSRTVESLERIRDFVGEMDFFVDNHSVKTPPRETAPHGYLTPQPQQNRYLLEDVISSIGLPYIFKRSNSKGSINDKERASFAADHLGAPYIVIEHPRNTEEGVGYLTNILGFFGLTGDFPNSDRENIESRILDYYPYVVPIMGEDYGLEHKGNIEWTLPVGVEFSEGDLIGKVRGSNGQMFYIYAPEDGTILATTLPGELVSRNQNSTIRYIRN